MSIFITMEHSPAYEHRWCSVVSQLSMKILSHPGHGLIQGCFSPLWITSCWWFLSFCLVKMLMLMTVYYRALPHYLQAHHLGSLYTLLNSYVLVRFSPHKKNPRFYLLRWNLKGATMVDIIKSGTDVNTLRTNMMHCIYKLSLYAWH